MTTVKPSTTPKIKECCICGDLGLSYLLFRCQICQFRYQHKYCSNEYPAAKFYRLCNWCLSEKKERDESSQKAMKSSSSKKGNYDVDDDDKRSYRKERGNGNYGGVKIDKESVKKMPMKPIIVKKRAPEGSPTLASRKRITTVTGGGEGNTAVVAEKLRRTESEIVGNRGMLMRKQELRNNNNSNKVIRRYKSLGEVSC